MFHANGWTLVWTVTAVGSTHVCLPKIEPRTIFELMAREQITMLCAAPTVLISLANAPKEVRHLAPKDIRVVTAGAPPAASTIQRLEEELGWTISPWVIPSGGTSLSSSSTTRSSPEVISSTPCRALIAARSLTGRDVCSGRCSQTVMNGAVSVSP